jgi:hypothetical protein
MFGDLNMLLITLHFSRIGLTKGTGIEQQFMKVSIK